MIVPFTQVRLGGHLCHRFTQISIDLSVKIHINQRLSVFRFFLVCLPERRGRSFNANRLSQTADMVEEGRKYGRIAGVVIEAESNEAIPGAIVTVAGTTQGANTDLYGRFLVQNLLPGRCDVVVRMMGYTTKTVKCKVVAEQETFVAVKLKVKLLSHPKDWGAYKKMIENDQTGTVRKWTADEINKIPGH